MIETGWRTVILDSPSELSCSDGNLVIKNDVEKTIPLAELRTVLINSTATTLSVELINELKNNHVKVIFCDSRHNPSCEIAGYGGHNDSAGRLLDQTGWTEERKSVAWQSIVYHKINNQCNLLNYWGIPYPEKLNEYRDTIKENDSTNREGQASRIYFNRLFGMTFVRHSSDNINSALNYGYTILLSCVNRIVALYGYNTELGIKHCNRSNSFNLSCDIMEPFRPFVDLIVYINKENNLDWDYKKKLVALPYLPVLYDKNKTNLQNALEDYARCVLNFMKTGDEKLLQKEINFVQKEYGTVG